MDLYVVDKGHPRLALAELQALAPGGRFWALNGALSGEGIRPSFARLAYTKAVYEVLFTCPPHELLPRLSAYNWSRAILPPYRVTNLASTIRTIEVADAIWRAQEHPQVDLRAPKTHLALLPIGDQVAMTIQTFENREDFEGRRAHLRPALHPSGLHPKLARCLVNLSGVQLRQSPALRASRLRTASSKADGGPALHRKPRGFLGRREPLVLASQHLRCCGRQKSSISERYGVAAPAVASLGRRAGPATDAITDIMDPFCGTGGLLIEAGLMGLEARGSDIDLRQVERAKKNLQSFGLERISIALADALSVSTPAAAIVTDLPYGRNTSPRDLSALYARFFAHAAALAGTLVIGLPRAIPPPLEGTPWQVAFEDEYYLHRSLRKTILVLRRKH